PAPRDLKSGDGFFLGDLFLVATTDVKNGELVQGMIEGGVALAKGAGYTPQPGDVATFDEGLQTLTATSGKPIGVIYVPTSPDVATEAWVKLLPKTAAPATP